MRPSLALGILGAIAALATLAALAAAGLLAFTYLHARTLLRPYRKPLPSSLDELGLPLEEVCIPGPQGTLTGWYLSARNDCTLICCHGIHDNAAQWWQQVARLHARDGYGALMFDFAGHGRSDGTTVTFGVREQEDVRAALDYLRTRGDVNMERIGLLGYSLGAITAVLFAAQHPEVRAVVVESAFADLQRDIAAVFRRYTGLPPFPFAQLVVFWAERQTGARLAEVRPAQVIGRISPRPVLIISDLKDDLADEPYDGEHLYLNAGQPKELWQVPDAGHIQAFTLRPEEWIARVGDFLDRYLAGNGAASSAHVASQTAAERDAIPTAREGAP
jgi:pimeloyl-ACP methyl ester carboxylesterase